MKFFAAAVVSQFLLLGCSSAPILGEHSSALNRAPICCSTVESVATSPLTDTAELRLEISTQSPAFLFPEGKSFFRAYQLQIPSGVAYRLSIRTYAINTSTITSAHVLIPRITFFNAAFKPIASVSPELVHHRPTFAIGESWWQGEILLDPSTAYVFVHTGIKEKSLVLRMPDSDAGAIYAGGVLIPNSRGFRLLPGGPTGEVSLSLRKQ
jgi:hypothetical protein